MTKCQVIGKSMEFGPGTVLELNENQANRRSHNLEKMEKGVYRATQMVQFKNGEVVGYDGEIPKGLRDRIIRLDEPEKNSGAKYEAMDVGAIREEAKKRELPFHPNTGKQKLIALLLEDDQKE